MKNAPKQKAYNKNHFRISIPFFDRWISKSSVIAGRQGASIREAHSKRISFLTGDISISKPTFIQKISDKLSALFHGFRGLDKYSDVAALYESKLRNMAEVWVCQAKSVLNEKDLDLPVDIDENSSKLEFEGQIQNVSLKEDGSPITAADRLRSEIAELEEKVKSQSSIELSPKENFQFWINEVETQMNKAKVEVDRYEEALGRPSYSLRYEEMIRKAHSALRKESNEQHEKIADGARSFAEGTTQISKIGVQKFFANAWDSVVKLFKHPTQSALFFVLFPVEILFTYPSFQAMVLQKSDESNGLSQHALQLGIAGALIYTLVLVALAAGSFMLLRYAVEYRFENDTDEKAKPKIVTKWRRIWLVSAVSVFLLGVGLAFFGAEIRGRVPKSEQMIELRTEAKSIENNLRANNPSQDEINEKNAKIAELNSQAENIRDELLRLEAADLKIDSTLEGVSIILYLGLFLITIIRLSVETDPVFNFALWTNYYQETKYLYLYLKDSLENEISNWRISEMSREADLKDRLRAKKAALGMICPDDPKALTIAGSKNNAFSEEGECEEIATSEKLELKRSEIKEDVKDLWIRNRLLRYLRTYLTWFGKGLAKRSADENETQLVRENALLNLKRINNILAG